MSPAAAIAVTGGIASGKSELTRRFEALGIAVLDADLVARELVEPGAPALAEVVARFGTALLDADGRLDRRALRAVVFADGDARRDLEAILHPRVRQALQQRAAAAPGPYVLVAVPLLVEGARRDPQAWAWIARVLVVDVPGPVQLARVMARDGIERDAALATIAAQATRDERLAAAHDVVVNDGPLAALDAVAGRLHARYLQARRRTSA